MQSRRSPCRTATRWSKARALIRAACRLLAPGGTLDAVIHDLASAGGHPYVDIAGETGPAFRRDPGRLFAADDYHPSDAGYRRWADAVVAAADEGDR